MPQLKELQDEILNYFTGKEVDEKTLNEKAQKDLSIYKSLVLSGMQGLIQKIFDKSYQVISDQFQDIVTDYLHQYPSKSPIYNELCCDFPKFLASDFFNEKYTYPSYLSELALYEYTELEIRNYRDIKTEKLINPVHKILKLSYPVSQIIEYIKEQKAADQLDELKETDIEAEAEAIVVFREPNSFETKFLMLSAPTLFVLEDLNSNNDIERTFDNFCLKFQIEANENTKAQYQTLIQQLEASSLIIKN